MRGRGKKEHRLHKTSKRKVMRPLKATDSVEDVIKNWEEAFSKGAFEFNQFIKSQRIHQTNPKEHLNLLDLDLKGISLANYDLRRVAFRDCKLLECHSGDSHADELYFINSILHQCDLVDIKWQDVGHKPTGLYLLESNVRASTITNSNLKIDKFHLRGTTITDSELVDITASALNWQTTEIDHSIINGIDVNEVTIEECLFTGVHWKGKYSVQAIGGGHNNIFERCDFLQLWADNKGRQHLSRKNQTHEAFTGQRGFSSSRSIWRECELPAASLTAFMPTNLPTKKKLFSTRPIPNMPMQYKEMTNNKWFDEDGILVATKPWF